MLALPGCLCRVPTHLSAAEVLTWAGRGWGVAEGQGLWIPHCRAGSQGRSEDVRPSGRKGGQTGKGRGPGASASAQHLGSRAIQLFPLSPSEEKAWVP